MIFQYMMPGFSCLCNQKSLFSSFFVRPSDSSFLCSATVIMKGISMSFCAEVQRTCLPCVLQSQFVMHISFRVHALHLITLLISYLLNLFCHFSCLVKSYLHKHLLNIHTSSDAPDCSVCSSQMHLNSKVEIVLISHYWK